MTAPKKVAPEVHLTDGKITTSSLTIANHFGKNHRDILKAIKNLDCPEDFNERNFAPVEYKDAKGEKRPAFQITRDGFAILVMGFTGKKAMEWKISYLEAFNQMEQKLLSAPEKPQTSSEMQKLIHKSTKNKKLKSDAPALEGLTFEQIKTLEAEIAEAAKRCNQPDWLIRGIVCREQNARYLTAIPKWRHSAAVYFVKNRMNKNSRVFNDREVFRHDDDAVLDAALEAHHQLGWCIRKLAAQAAEGKEAREKLDKMGKMLFGLPG